MDPITNVNISISISEPVVCATGQTRLDMCGPRTTGTTCTAHINQDQCSSDSSCSWQVYGVCSGPSSCTPLATQASCTQQNNGCSWLPTARCLSKCSQYINTSSCSANVQCAWIGCAPATCTGFSLAQCESQLLAPGCLVVSSVMCVKALWRSDNAITSLPRSDFCAGQCAASIALCLNDATCQSAINSFMSARLPETLCDSACIQAASVSLNSTSSSTLMSSALSCYFGCRTTCGASNACSNIYALCQQSQGCASMAGCQSVCSPTGSLIIFSLIESNEFTYDCTDDACIANCFSNAIGSSATDSVTAQALAACVNIRCYSGPSL